MTKQQSDDFESLKRQVTVMQERQKEQRKDIDDLQHETELNSDFRKSLKIVKNVLWAVAAVVAWLFAETHFLN